MDLSNPSQMEPDAPSPNTVTAGQISQLAAIIQSLQHQLQEHREAIIARDSILNDLRSTAATAPTAPTAATPTPPHSTPKIKVNPPTVYKGERKLTEAFLQECRTNFACNPSSFGSDLIKITWASSFLRGRAATWFRNVTKLNSAPSTFDSFAEQLGIVFGSDELESRTRTYDRLHSLKQVGTVQDYTVRFYSLASGLNLPEELSMLIYQNSLALEVKNYLVGVSPRPETLNQLVSLATEFDNNVRANTKSNKPPMQRFPPKTIPAGDPMDIDSQHISSGKPRGPLTEAEKKRRKENNLCLYDGDEACPGKNGLDKCPRLLARNKLGNSFRRG